MSINEKTPIMLQMLKDIRGQLDKIGVNTEVIENSNKLIYDKLEDLETLSNKKNLTKEEIAFKQYELERNSECYMTLSYVITRELDTINNTLQNIYNHISEIDTMISEEASSNDYR